MTISEIIKSYDKHMVRLCREYCHWRSCAVHSWCHSCPLWEFRGELEAAREQMEDDGK